MSEERIVEKLAQAFAFAAGWTWHDAVNGDPGPRARDAARYMLDSVRADGFDVYRPEECEVHWVRVNGDRQDYRLVPVEGD